MSNQRLVRRRAAEILGITGSALGVLAGTVQALVEARIPDWTGSKQAPENLGLLTIALSVLDGHAGYRQTRASASVTSRTGYAIVLLIPGLLCFSTVGRLWYLPGPMPLLAGLLSIHSVRDTATLVRRTWFWCLLGLLGAAELLMAAGAAPVVAAVGAVGGVALLVAGAVARSRLSLAVLVGVGTVPFAALAWTAVVPVLLLLVAVAIALPLARHLVPAPASRSAAAA